MANRRDTCRIESNSEIVDRILDSWRKLEAMPPELMDTDIEWVNPPDAVESGTRHGTEEFEGAQSAFGRAYSSASFGVEREIELRDGVGLVVEIVYQGRGSGIEVRQRLGMLFTIRDGKVIRFEWSRQPEDLLERAASD